MRVYWRQKKNLFLKILQNRPKYWHVASLYQIFFNEHQWKINKSKCFFLWVNSIFSNYWLITEPSSITKYVFMTFNHCLPVIIVLCSRLIYDRRSLIVNIMYIATFKVYFFLFHLIYFIFNLHLLLLNIN